MRIGGHKCHKRAGDPSMNFVCQFYVWIDGLVRHPATGLSALAHLISKAALYCGCRAKSAAAFLLMRPVDASFVQQFRHALACVEHARLDGVLGHAEHAGDFLDRFFLVVRKLDDFAMNT